MEKDKYAEMAGNLHFIATENILAGRKLFLFGHCNATEELADLLLSEGYRVQAILDNSGSKQELLYRGIPVTAPGNLDWMALGDRAVVLIVTRFYEAMSRQLRELGFTGRIEKLVDYNTYAEYSLSDESIARKKIRLERGKLVLEHLRDRYAGCFRIFCPFPALGDVYFTTGYLPCFMKERGIDLCVVCVPTESCRKVVDLFGAYNVAVLPQKDLDAAIQAAVYTQDKDSFVAHQDRPYVVSLSKALYLKKISLEEIYAKGVFGLTGDYHMAVPRRWKDYAGLEDIRKRKSVILSPYAKSVVALPDGIWKGIAEDMLKNGYQVFTNVYGSEKPIEGTEPISPEINEMKSVVERAGIFVGIRSGLCDVLRTADCKKVALYPDYYYCDTRWKSIDMYSIDSFNNVQGDDLDEILKVIYAP